MTQGVFLTQQELTNLIEDVSMRTAKNTIDEIEARKPKRIIMFTSKQVMEQLQISESTFRRWVKEGTIKAKKIGRDVKVSEEDLNEALKDVKSLKYRR